MIKTLLSIPASIFVGTLNLFVQLCLSIIGIPIAILVLICGTGLALVALMLVLLPIGILIFI